MAEKKIESLLHETRSFEPPADFAARAHIKSRAEYDEQVGTLRSDLEKLEAELPIVHGSERDDALTRVRQARRAMLEKQDAVLDAMRMEVFVHTREASRLALGEPHYDIQMVGGFLLTEVEPAWRVIIAALVALGDYQVGGVGAAGHRLHEHFGPGVDQRVLSGVVDVDAAELVVTVLRSADVDDVATVALP